VADMFQQGSIKTAENRAVHKSIIFGGMPSFFTPNRQIWYIFLAVWHKNRTFTAKKNMIIETIGTNNLRKIPKIIILNF